MGPSFLVRNFCWHVAVADVELLVEMGQLPARVLEEEFSVQRESCGEYIGEQETTVGEDEPPAAWANAADARISEQDNVTNAGRASGKQICFEGNSSLPASSFRMMRAGPASGFEGKLSPDRVTRE
jgi:hypothetical protein